jgi:hypothetical protein
VLAAAVPAAVVLFLGELAHRFAAQLLKPSVDGAYVEKQLLSGRGWEIVPILMAR